MKPPTVDVTMPMEVHVVGITDGRKRERSVTLKIVGPMAQEIDVVTLFIDDFVELTPRFAVNC